MSYEALTGIPLYMRGQFVSGGGLHAPGGLTIGPTYGPGGPGGMVGPGSCPEVPGGHEVCVHPPMTETGPDRTPWQQREMSREEYDLQDSGCVPSSRHCGGSPRMPSRSWCCPGGPGGGIPGFVGYTFPGMGALGSGPGGYSWVDIALFVALPLWVLSSALVAAQQMSRK